MDKRTKILLIVLAGLIVVGGGYYVYTYVTAEKPAPTPVRAAAKPRKPAGPAPTTAAPAPAASVKSVAPAAATKTPAGITAAKAPAAAPAAKAPATSANAKAPASMAAVLPYAPVLKVIEKGRQAQYNSPDEFLGKTKMSPDEIRAFSRKGVDEAKKAVDGLQKGKAAKDALDRAYKDLQMMEKLAGLVNAKFPEEKAKVYAYYSLGKRDPFMSPLEVPKALPKVTPGMTPLEKTPTETLVLKAVLWTSKGYRAMIETPDGRDYTVKQGDLVGNKGGNITRITERMVYVTEKITDILGDVETRNIALKLHKEAE